MRKRIRSNIQSAVNVLLVSLVAGVMAVSCSEGDCSLLGRPRAQFKLYSSQTKQAITYLDTLTITALYTDSVFLNRFTNFDAFSLPLRYTEEETVFVITAVDSISTWRDTIRIYHTNKPFFSSLDCGREMFHTIQSITTTTHLLDSIVLINPDVDTYEKENFQIFYPTEF